MIQIIIMLLVPLMLILGTKKFPLLEKIGTVIIAYAIGILWGNSGLPLHENNSKTLIEVAVPLSIGLILISSNILLWLKEARTTILSFIFCTLGITSGAIIAFFLFQNQIDDTHIISGMSIGLYTGGTPNMSAIGVALKADEDSFILMNTADMLLGGIWMLYLISIAKKIFGKFLPSFSSDQLKSNQIANNVAYTHPKLLSILKALGVVVLNLGVCVGISILLFDKMDEIFIILGVTTLCLLASNIRSIRTIEGSYIVGEYFILLFCLGLGSLSNFNQLIESGGSFLAFTFTVMSIGITIHFILSKLFKIDTDTFLVTSTACLYGPAFVGPIAKALKNKHVVVSGMTAGALGYAIANYWGIFIAEILKNLF
ncbi:DUF819 family protein [Flammeovirga yaeyamensis]|uniref:DUF819 family protein n=2 Tax=Flammeovirga yaeyamensis TaxID=367791 RepID=A0AAX1MZM6_9BACT|nr:DUF819 family protein [Flammeovirga yaeyamensis]MBB3700287.1 putative membrane protein [Flammeovirga yaeyamensis]NMF37087.1 DUF819 family protein [Flammeovirga yaeyamensis]QWG00778.1 DUF819 family protein [Flammeovirga yaeyamensis]